MIKSHCTGKTGLAKYQSCESSSDRTSRKCEDKQIEALAVKESFTGVNNCKPGSFA